MEILYFVSMIILSFSISLGVGSSTLAVSNFLKAIADGTIDPGERNIMGVTYFVLRVAMVQIAMMLILQYIFGHIGIATPYYGTAQAWGAGILVSILYLNAILMTYHLIPNAFGPAIQASAWYTLGVLAALIPLGVTNFSLLIVALLYGCFFMLALAVINGVMSWLKHRAG